MRNSEGRRRGQISAVLRRMGKVGMVAGAITVAAPIAHADQLFVQASGSPSVAVRHLQTMLMVAALTCDARKQYNAFVAKFRPSLAEHGKALKHQFAKAYGAAANAQLNAYVTALANEKSLEASRDRPAFCARTGELFTSATVTEASNIGQLARAVTATSVAEGAIATR